MANIEIFSAGGCFLEYYIYLCARFGFTCQ